MEENKINQDQDNEKFIKENDLIINSESKIQFAKYFKKIGPLTSYKISIKKLLIFIAIIFSFVSNININKTKNITLKYKELIFDNITISYNKAIPFIKKNIEGKLDSIYNSTNNHEIIPLVTAIIPVYNSKDIILRSIRSIQNQDMKDIEIILVDDFSTDNTTLYIENLKKEDSRIKIIKNKKIWVYYILVVLELYLQKGNIFFL